MKRTINIHEPSSWIRGKEFISGLVLNSITNAVETMPYMKDNWETISLSAYASEAFDCIGESNLYSDVNHTYTFLYYYNQMYYAWYLSTMNDGKPLVLRVINKDIHTTGRLNTGAISSFFLLRCISTAMILRDKQALDYYAAIPVEFTEKGGQDDLMYETMMFFYQVLIKGSHPNTEALAAVESISSLMDWDEYKSTVYVEGYNTDHVWRILFDYRKPMFEHIHVPVLQIYHAIFLGNKTLFEDAVYDALQEWKAYYSQGEYEMHGQEYEPCCDREGFVALPIIAACAYAFDKGMTLDTVESDYLPKWMIEGKFDDLELLV